MAATLLLERCNPYGAETGGPQRVMGGLHGPNSARTSPDMALPDNIVQGEWLCPQQAQVRVRMECRCGHVGRVMALCSEHDEIVEHGEMVGGKTRKVRDVVRVRGHYEEIQRRQAGLCIPCAYPSGKNYDFAADYKAIMGWQNELAWILDAGGPMAWHSARARQIRQHIEDIVAGFDQGIDRGMIHRCPMRLVPVS